MASVLNFLVIEDSRADFLLMERNIKQGGLLARCVRVETIQELESAIDTGDWDVVLSDYSVPRLDFTETFNLIQARMPDVPIILVSGSIGEERAVELLKLGICDFILKDSLARLVPAIKRSLEEAAEHRARCAAEEALRQSEERYRSLVETSFDWIWEINAQANYTYVSSRVREILGYAPEEVVGRTPFDFMSADEARRVKAIFTGIASERRPFCLLENINLHRDGRPVVLETSGAPVFGQDGDFIGYRGTDRDITERKKAQDALRHSEERMRLIIESSPIGMRIVQQGRHVYANPALIRMFGYADNEEMEGLPADSFYLPEDRQRVRQSIADIQAGMLPSPVYEATGLTKSGKHFDVTVRVTPIDYRGKQASLAFITDVSTEKSLRTQLFRAQKMEAIGTLAGGIAHDFNNILGIIMGNTEMALLDTPEDSPTYDFLQQVTKAAFRAKDLVKQILTFSRQGEQEQRPLHIIPIIKEALKLLRSSLPTTIAIRQEISVPFAQDSVFADSTQIHQILMNLCANSAHAMREAGGILEVNYSSMDFSAEDLNKPHDLSPGSYLVLLVSDTGHGMSKEVMERIFEPYFTTKKPEEGTGLGLAVVHGIVKKHGGAITVTSAPGEGSAFHIFLPRWHGSGVDQKRDIHSPLQRGTESILLVDDEKALIEAVQRMLEQLGYTVVAKTCGVEALEEFRARPDAFDLVITDQTMPKMTGLDLSRELMAIRPDLPVILCTGFSENLTAEKCKASGVRALLMKPVALSSISSTIRKVLNGEEQE